MTFNKVMFSSEDIHWKTPDSLLLDLKKEFGEMFDPCPSNPTFDGLKIPWKDVNFVNPPYGREISKWCKKAYEEYCKGKIVVMLVPSRTDTKWWHEYIMKAKEIRFLKGRLKFSEHKNSAPFPSAVVVFK